MFKISLLKGAISFLPHARANENQLENINPTFLSSVGDFRKAVFICLYLSHHLIVSTVLYQESFCGDYRQIFVSFLKLLFALGICLPGFTVSSYRRPLDWQKINDHYSTMSDGILDGIFLIWLTEPFCWVILEAAGAWIFFLCVCVLKVCGHIMRWLSSWRWLFLLITITTTWLWVLWRN